MCEPTSSFSSVASLAPRLSEIFMNLRKIVNGGAATSKSNTQRSNNQAKYPKKQQSRQIPKEATIKPIQSSYHSFPSTSRPRPTSS
ncbi:hypothetical protein AVEN_262862-1 [Araneus ventricosus]|uniref:Uncharacterized protein n=1 Tax=Araneus ventricosus TaxID=182803 RepID=A0A4Y2DIL4_ARAVE|nr:hypothetical protein AVEN_262862-1 [Araneus ventricosus]